MSAGAVGAAAGVMSVIGPEQLGRLAYQQLTGAIEGPQTFVAEGGLTYYPNCDAARAAGAAPLTETDPGYRSELDADDDGIACEPLFRAGEGVPATEPDFEVDSP